jgi:hypothetical protein
MPRLALLIGLLLLIIGLGGYLLGFREAEPPSWTALFPAAFGLVIFVCGIVGMQNEQARRHAMHIAVAAALLGAIASMMPLFTRILDPDVETSWLTKTSVIGTIVLCLWLVIAGVMSFSRARRQRQAAV